MKKLLFVISQLYRGGAETSLVNLLSQLDEKIYDIELLILNQCPVENAVSLIPELPPYVKVCNVYGKKGTNSIWNRVKGKLIYKKVQKQQYLLKALNFVQNKTYDWAFAVGEWSMPTFVAKEVVAKHKALWIHNDLSMCTYFQPEEYFECLDRFEKVIFVSKRSMDESLKAYPFLRSRFHVIYNINCADKIISEAKHDVTDAPFNNGLPTLVTCANLRSQKNHIRQVEAMAELKRRGVDFNWVNIGALSDTGLFDQVCSRIKENGLEDRFLMLGSRANPYPYLSRATAVTVLSDYESWSMVITEAKILGVPVISTKTSGALEQIEHGKTGILTDFTVQDIADQIEAFLKNDALQSEIRKNLHAFDNTPEILESFRLLVNSESASETSAKNKILYVIDDINYMGGAHIATKNQIKYLLENGRDISIFSINTPNLKVRQELCGVKFISWFLLKEDTLFNRRLLNVLTNKHYSGSDRLFKLKMTFRSKSRLEDDVFHEMVIANGCSRIFSEFDTICVISEASEFKQSVAESTARTKIQWIHTDYCLWKRTNPYAAKVAEHDDEIWKKFDRIVVLTEGIRNSVSAMYPHLADKISVSKNILPVDNILSGRNVKNQKIHFVTVGSLESPKAYDRLLPVLSRLYAEGYDFDWKIIGNGPERPMVEHLIFCGGLSHVVTLEGTCPNPFRHIAQADVFALLSVREGLPNSIYEALILGIPVLATNTGGISEQVISGETGWLVSNSTEGIYEGVKHILTHPEEIPQLKKKLESYRYDNQKCYDDMLELFKI